VSAPVHPGEKLSAYLDDELAPAERAAVDVHLGECAACAQMLEELAAVDSFSRTLAAQAPEGYFDAFPGRVRERLAARRPRRLPAWTWAAAAAVLLAVVTPLTLLDQRQAPSSAEMKAQQEEPLLRQAQPPAAPPPAAATPAPPTTLAADVEEKLRPQLELRQKRDGARDDRLRERDADRPTEGVAGGVVGGVAGDVVTPGRRTAELKDAELKKEAFGEKAGADKPQQNVAAPPAAAPATPLPDEMAVVAPPRVATRTDQSAAKSRAEPAPAAPAEAPRGQTYAAKPSPSAGTLNATAAGSSPRATLSADEAGAAREFEAQAAGPVRTAEEARVAARQWDALARRHPAAPTADEARVRAIEALATAFRLERKDADREAARKAARAYLAGSGAHKDRVRAVLDQLAR
jgi:hypothetical protein